MIFKPFFKITKKYFLSYKLIVFQFVFLITQLLKTLIPFILIYIVNNILINNDNTYLYEAIVVNFFSLLCYSLLSYFSNSFFIDYINDKSLNLKKDIYINCMNSDADFYEKHNVGDMAYRLSNDTSVIASGWTFVFGSSVAQLISIVVFFIIIKFQIILLLFIFFMILIDIIFIVIYMKMIDSKIIVYKNSSQNIYKKLFDSLSKIEIINNLNLVNLFTKKFENNIEKNNLEKKDYLLTEKLFELISNSISTIISISIIIIGSILIKKSLISIGSLIAFISFSGMIFQPINSIIKGLRELKEVNISAERIFEYLSDSKDDIKEQEKIDKINNIILHNVSIYRKGKEIISNINYEFNSPNLYIIKGKNGIGKTTLAKNIAKIYSEFKGDIEINSISYLNISRKSLSTKIVYINNNDAIFEGSLKFNILLEKENFKDNENYEYVINKYLSKKFILGLETILSDKSIITLSSGEKQLIYIIRALLLKPQVLILDEPEFSLDSEIKNIIYELLMSYSKSAIVIVLTHDSFLFSKCNNILELKK